MHGILYYSSNFRGIVLPPRACARVLSHCSYLHLDSGLKGMRYSKARADLSGRARASTPPPKVIGPVQRNELSEVPKCLSPWFAQLWHPVPSPITLLFPYYQLLLLV